MYEDPDGEGLYSNPEGGYEEPQFKEGAYSDIPGNTDPYFDIAPVGGDGYLDVSANDGYLDVRPEPDSGGYLDVKPQADDNGYLDVKAPVDEMGDGYLDVTAAPNGDGDDGDDGYLDVKGIDDEDYGFGGDEEDAGYLDM